ncbi:unnamed protein product [Cunninghamella blakesleeana]
MFRNHFFNTTNIVKRRTLFTSTQLNKERVSIIGSGNWGTTIAKIIGENVQKNDQLFETQVRQWVFEEEYNGKHLAQVINESHENPKYLPGIQLPHNIQAEPNLITACENSSVLVFCLPHQFVDNVTKQLADKIIPRSSTSIKIKAISLIKGLDIQPNGIHLYSKIIGNRLNLSQVAVLSGANIANEVAKEQFCETTIGSPSLQDGELFFKLFNTPYFRANVIRDSIGVELCGALKNIVAVAAGISDGLGCGSNTKAALIRIGLMEMKKFGKAFFGNTVEDSTFFESCGIADLITTCSSGRNRKVAEAFIKTGKPIDVLETELLNGQKLQGTLTALEVHQFLVQRSMVLDFPLFNSVYNIIYKNAPYNSILNNI